MGLTASAAGVPAIFLGPRSGREIARAATLALGLAACSSKDDPTRAVPLASNDRVGLERALTDEVLVGKETALGFPLPLRATVDQRFPDVVYATVSVPYEKVLGFVADHGKKKFDPKATKFDVYTFDDVTSPASASQKLRVRVERTPSGTRLVVRDATPKKAEIHATEEERWRAAGLRPDGRPLEPHGQ